MPKLFQEHTEDLSKMSEKNQKQLKHDRPHLAVLLSVLNNISNSNGIQTKAQPTFAEKHLYNLKGFGKILCGVLREMLNFLDSMSCYACDIKLTVKLS